MSEKKKIPPLTPAMRAGLIYKILKCLKNNPEYKAHLESVNNIVKEKK